MLLTLLNGIGVNTLLILNMFPRSTHLGGKRGHVRALKWDQDNMTIMRTKIEKSVATRQWKWLEQMELTKWLFCPFGILKFPSYESYKYVGLQLFNMGSNEGISNYKVVALVKIFSKSCYMFPSKVILPYFIRFLLSKLKLPI
jgi:hypothetical protein